MATVSLTSFPEPEVITCNHCRSAITLYDPAGSEFCSCPSCRTYVQFIGEAQKKVKTLSPPTSKPIIPLGTEGVLQNIPFKVIGFMEKDEGTKSYPGWREYLLYNYEKGYAIVSEYNGHWNLILDKSFLPKLENVFYGITYITYDDVKYRLFHKYTPRVLSLIGESDWDVHQEKLTTAEFIAPPYIVAREAETGKNHQVINYYRGEYLEAEVISEAFKLDLTLFPAKVDVISNQPSKAYHLWNWSLHASLLSILCLLLITLLGLWAKPEQVLVDSVYNLSYDPEKGVNEFKPFVTSPFNVEYDSSPIEINISSAINNNWLETTIVLVNEASNETWEVTNGFEYYEGVEDGEKWSEGAKSAEVLLSAIPKGKYHLNIYPASGDSGADVLAIKVTSNIALWRNLVVCLAFFSLLPAYSYLRMRNFEKRRWANSDYSPFEE